MRRYILFGVLVFFISCSEDDSSKTIVYHDEANFSLLKNSSRIDWSNVLVGDVLKFDVKIKNFDSSADVVYVLKPITVDATLHQRNKIDYNFQEEIKVPSLTGLAKDSIFTKKIRDSIIIKKPNSSFIISILQPGNFRQQYELRKMRANKYVAATTQEILLSAVKIEVYTWNEQTDNSTMFSNSKHSRYYEFTIDDGDQTNDTYLTNSESKENNYVSLYNDKKYSGVIKINEKMTFSEKVNTEKGAQIVPTWILSEIKITQKRDYEPDNIIVYSNLSLKQK
jgi:hypothetical protein